MESGRIRELIGRNVLGVRLVQRRDRGSEVLIKPSDAHRSKQLKRSRFQANSGMRAEIPYNVESAENYSDSSKRISCLRKYQVSIRTSLS